MKKLNADRHIRGEERKVLLEDTESLTEGEECLLSISDIWSRLQKGRTL